MSFRFWSSVATTCESCMAAGRCTPRPCRTESGLFLDGLEVELLPITDIVEQQQYNGLVQRHSQLLATLQPHAVSVDTKGVRKPIFFVPRGTLRVQGSAQGCAPTLVDGH